MHFPTKEKLDNYIKEYATGMAGIANGKFENR
jgi:hypothetical protein